MLCLVLCGHAACVFHELACVVEMKEWMQRICHIPMRMLRALSTRFFFFRARDFTIITLHNLTDFYVERVTAHHIKINDHSCFHNLWPQTSLGARGPPGVSGGGGGGDL